MASIVLAVAAWIARRLPSRWRPGLYRLGPITRGARRLLNAAAPAGITEIEVASGPVAGARLRLDLQIEKDLWLGTYELELAQAIRDWVRPASVAYDVGANLGYLTLTLARAVGPAGSVTAFEPHPENFTRLRSNLGLNPEAAWVRPVQAAVGGQSGRQRLLLHPSGSMARLEGANGRRFEPIASVEVPVVALDEWVFDRGEPAPALVKIDVEGGEAQVLAGMARLLAQARPVVLAELHGPEAAAGARRELEAAGYQLREVRPGYPAWQPGAWRAYVIGLPPTPEALPGEDPSREGRG